MRLTEYHNRKDEPPQVGMLGILFGAIVWLVMFTTVGFFIYRIFR